MLKINLNDDEIGTIRNGLLIAIERFVEHKRTMQQVVDAGDQPTITAAAGAQLRDQFSRQIEETKAVLDRLEQAEEF